jgi:chromosome partitioning protein
MKITNSRNDEIQKTRMVIIGLISQKGGVGKSSMARALATHYAQSGLSVKIADLDINQSTAYQWQQRRLQADMRPAVSVECFGSVAHALKQSAGYDVLLLDGAPHSSKQTLQIAQAADLVVIPTGLSIDDLEPSVILANSLRSAKVPTNKIAFALSRTGDSRAELDDAQEYLQATPYTLLPGHIQEKTAFRRAQDSGRSLPECPYPAQRKQARAMVAAIQARINEIQN